MCMRAPAQACVCVCVKCMEQWNLNEFDIYSHDDELMMLMCLIETIKIACKTRKITIRKIVFSFPPCFTLFLSSWFVVIAIIMIIIHDVVIILLLLSTSMGWMSLFLKCVQYACRVFVFAFVFTCVCICVCECLTSNQLTLNINYNLSMSLVWTNL